MASSAEALSDGLEVFASSARYIKLGPGNVWFDRCVDEGLLAYGEDDVSGEPWATQDWEAYSKRCLAEGRSDQVARMFTDQARGCCQSNANLSPIVAVHPTLLEA